jgi:hypothetical protein
VGNGDGHTNELHIRTSRFSELAARHGSTCGHGSVEELHVDGDSHGCRFIYAKGEPSSGPMKASRAWFIAVKRADRASSLKSDGGEAARAVRSLVREGMSAMVVVVCTDWRGLGWWGDVVYLKRGTRTALRSFADPAEAQL